MSLVAKVRAAVRNKFLRDTATLQVAGGLNQLSQLASTVIIAFLLGDTGQGQFVLAIALQAFTFFLLNVGVYPATVSQIAAASAREMEHKVAAWIAFLGKAVLVFAVLIAVFGWFFLPWAGERFYEDRNIGIWALWLCLQPIVELPKIVATVSFQGTRRMLALGQLENSHELVRFFLVALGALLTGSAAGAIAGQILAGVFGSAIAFGLYANARKDGAGYLPSVREILRWVPDVPIRKGMRLGFRVGLVKNAHMMVMTVIPRLVIGGIVSVEYAAYFHIAHRIISVPMMLAMGVSRTMLPALGELAGLRDIQGFRRLFLRVALTTGGLITAGFAMGLPMVPYLVGWAFPTGYAGPVSTYANILAIGAITFSFAVANEAFFIATNQVRLWLWLSLVGTFVTVPTAAWLVAAVPIWGTAWGISFIQNWVLVHFACIGWYLYRKRHDTLFGGAEPAPAEPAAETAGAAPVSDGGGARS